MTTTNSHSANGRYPRTSGGGMIDYGLIVGICDAMAGSSGPRVTRDGFEPAPDPVAEPIADTPSAPELEHLVGSTDTTKWYSRTTSADASRNMEALAESTERLWAAHGKSRHEPAPGHGGSTLRFHLGDHCL